MKGFCPHYNEEGRECFDSMITELEEDGLALENETAFVEAAGEQFIITSRSAAKAWMFKKNEKQALDVTFYRGK